MPATENGKDMPDENSNNSIPATENGKDMSDENSDNSMPATEIGKTDGAPSHEHSLEELIDLIAKTDEDENAMRTLLTDTYREYKEFYNSHANTTPEQAKAMLAEAKLIERAALVIHTLNTFNAKYDLRTVQELSILLSLVSIENKAARLLQVPTGEGKTNVIAAIAAVKASYGIKVDIVTSSSELATSQEEHMKPFFELLGISTGHNSDGKAHDDNNNLADYVVDVDERKVYDSTVIYGPITDFLADILLQEAMNLEVRGERGHELAIVDEVDSMLLDGRTDSVRIASKTPGMSDVLPVYAAIWAHIQLIYKSMEFHKGKWHLVDGTQLIPIESVDDFIESATLTHIRKVLRFDEITEEDLKNVPPELEGEEYPEIIVPEYLRAFLEQTLTKLIRSAVSALFHVKEGHEYVVEGSKIVIVDAFNTGLHNPTMQWSHGLHQFLQMKHSVPIEAESVATNFLSNVTFFLRYGANIIGLTGTIGGEDSREFLKETYGVTFSDIPSFRERRYEEVEPIVCQNEEEWLEKIVSSTESVVNAERAVLIIAPFIASADKIRERLDGKGIRSSMYTDSRTGSEALQRELVPGDCVVATNIAGRGTDFHVGDEVESKGGLHVIVAFLPENDRVERQAVGRTARTGQRGSGQLILDLSEMKGLLGAGDVPSGTPREIVDSFKQKRANRCLEHAKTALEQVEECKKRAEVFAEYLKLRKERSNGKANPESDALDNLFGLFVRAHENDMSVELLREAFEKTRITSSYDLVGMGKYKEAVKQDKHGLCLSAAYSRAAEHVKRYSRKQDRAELDRAIDAFGRVRRNLKQKMDRQRFMIQVAGVPTKIVGRKQQEATAKAAQTANGQGPANPSNSTGVNLGKLGVQELENGGSANAAAGGPGEEKKTLLYAQVERQMTVLRAIEANVEGLIGKDMDKEIKELEDSMKEAEGEEKTQYQDAIQDLKEGDEQTRIGILGIVKNKGCEIKISYVSIKDLLARSLDASEYENEIQSCAADHINSVMEVKEHPPINWGNVIGLFCLSLLQMVGGALATIFTGGAGAELGMSLFMEGVSDLMKAIKEGIIDRTFDWAAYGIEKGIALVVTLCTFGFSALKTAAKGAAEGAKKAGAQILSRTAATKGGVKAAAKQFTIQVAKTAVNVGVAHVLDQVVPKLESEIIEPQIRKTLVDVMNNYPNFQLLLTYEKCYSKPMYAEKLKKEVSGIIATDVKLFDDAVSSIGAAWKDAENELSKDDKTASKICRRLASGVNFLLIGERLVPVVKTAVDNLVAEHKKSKEAEKTDREVTVEKMLEPTIKDIVSYIAKRAKIAERCTGYVAKKTSGLGKKKETADEETKPEIESDDVEAKEITPSDANNEEKEDVPQEKNDTHNAAAGEDQEEKQK